MISGMMCNNCKRHVEEALEKLNLNYEVSLEKGCAILNDCILSDETIIEAIDQAGYDVEKIIHD